MKYLIAGLGSIGRRHMRNLIALGERDIILYRTRKATMSDDELAGFPVETDLQEALNKHKPDAVIVGNPTSMHLDVAIPAADAGCSILLEKPISNSTERLDQLEAVVKKKRIESIGRVSIPLSSWLDARQSIDLGRRDRTDYFSACAFW